MKAHLAYLCSSTSWGGLEMNHLRNARWMHERGHKVIVLAVADSRYHQEALSMDLPVLTIPAHRKYYDWKAGRALTAIIQKEQITHLILRSTRDMSIAAYIKSRLKNGIHTSYFMEMQLGVRKTNWLHATRQKGIDLWSCPLPWLEQQVKTMTRFRNTLVEIPSGLDLSQYEHLPTQKEAREKLSLPENELIFGLIGRFDPQKGQLLLLEAAKMADDKNFHIALLGEPTINEGVEYSEKINQFIAENRLEARVHIRPFMSNPEVFYTALDWMVMATKAETFGMVTVESLACGTPVLGSNAGGTPEILENGKGGLLFESMDAQDLSNKINTICSDNPDFSPEKLKEIARKYDFNSVCDQVEIHLNLV